VKNKKNSHARQEISNRKNGKSTRISLNWWILYMHYNLKFKAVGFSVPSLNLEGWGGSFGCFSFIIVL